MKQIFLITLLFTSFLNINAQNTEKVTDVPQREDLSNLVSKLDKKIPEQVKLVGIGNVSVMAKESSDLSMEIAKYLISEKKFRNLVLLEEDWLLRPLNEYLTNKNAFDSTTVDSLVKISLVNSTSFTESFSSFAMWLKKYNLKHPDALVQLSGVVPDNLIPPAYFLATYVIPLDREYGVSLSKKWGVYTSHDNELAFNEISIWYQQISNNTSKFKKYKQLLLQCAEDIDHNNIIRKGDTLKTAIDNKAGSMVELLLKKAEKRTILYGENENITTSQYVFKGDTISSLGRRLYAQLKNKYFTCLTDFADSAKVNIFDNQAGELKLITIPGTVQTSKLYKEKPVLFWEGDSMAMKHYQPSSIFPIMDIERRIIPDNKIPVVDALFIINHLTPISFLKRLRNLY
ncbi:hypothetical protein DVR12_00235 [Chitinophaga silvatica]|uniref:Uncharacterized protein n=1 Tax=Chitinophaga silvatica TaxID=2282649 RepID=A0A3E1YFU5_9BACT|nr:hypothetical protein [Chitinophaga silvatica]RFS26254.1 hypothetical protein DVR12_00235 [Chitinophaga silvatica]